MRAGHRAGRPRYAYSPRVHDQIVAAYKAFSADLGEEDALVSVRSSADKEDLDGASFAGQYATVLNVRGVRALLRAARHVWASAFSPDAISYARANRPDAQPAKMAIIVQQMVQPKVAGTVFSVDLETGAPLISINAVYGLGDSLVGGRTTPDIFLVDPISQAIVKRRLGAKTFTEIYDPARQRTVRVRTAPADAQCFTLSPAETRELARQAVRSPGSSIRPRAVWRRSRVCHRRSWHLYAQARPETAWARPARPVEMVDPDASGCAEALLFVAGVSGSPGVVSGRICLASSVEEAERKLRPGDILVVAETTHAWERYLHLACGVITRIGGPSGHSAVVMRKLRKPALVGVGRAVRLLEDGQMVTLDATRRVVWDGAVPAIVLPVPPPPQDASFGPSAMSEDDAWDRAGIDDHDTRRYRVSPLDWQAGVSRLSPFMQQIYQSAHEAAGRRLGIPTDVQI